MNNWLSLLPRHWMQWSLFLFDIIILPLLFVFSLWLANNQGDLNNLLNWSVLALIPVICIPVFIRLGLYRAIIRYLGSRALWTTLKAVSMALALWFAVSRLLIPSSDLNFTALVLFWLMSIFAIGGSRFSIRALLWMKRGHVPRALIYGAGDTGINLVNALRYGADLLPVALVDDNVELQGREVSGIRVYPPEQLSALIEQYDIKDVLIALPSASAQRKKELITLLEPLPVHVRILPGLKNLSKGELHIEDLKELDIEDLLGREPVVPDSHLLSKIIANKNVMITGAGGSIGSEICRQIVNLSPAHIVLIDNAEHALYQMEMELIDAGVNHLTITSYLESVQKQSRMSDIIKDHNIDTIFHAAAYKHVPMVEKNIISAIENNVFGTLAISQAAKMHDVETFVLISTDKAVRPTNVMGASKRIAERILQSSQLLVENNTRFISVRFGNVLDSSGSVVPRFRKQIQSGGPVTVTHPEVSRYFMTIPEAVQLVIQAGALGNGGDVFILNMGEQIKINDLAKKMIRLMGYRLKDEFNPDGDISIQYTGLRPAEKLYEELLVNDNAEATSHPGILRAYEEAINWADLTKYLDILKRSINSNDISPITEVLAELVEGYIYFHGQLTSEILDLAPAGHEVEEKTLLH